MDQYQEYITKYYNPNKEHFASDEEYKKLYYGWQLGDPKQSTEFLKKICLYGYDCTGALYGTGMISGTFEDALQNTFIFLQDFDKPIPANMPKMRKVITSYLKMSFMDLDKSEKEANLDLNYDKDKIVDSKTVYRTRNFEEGLTTRMNFEKLIKDTCRMHIPGVHSNKVLKQNGRMLPFPQNKSSKEVSDEVYNVRLKIATGYLCDNKKTKDLAKELGLSETTINNTLSKVFQWARIKIAGDKHREWIEDHKNDKKYESYMKTFYKDKLTKDK